MNECFCNNGGWLPSDNPYRTGDLDDGDTRITRDPDGTYRLQMMRDTVYTTSAPINYCPMCGREL